jgi:hypothetical protein
VPLWQKNGLLQEINLFIIHLADIWQGALAHYISIAVYIAPVA